MMRAINGTQFGGRRAVTCQTCRNGCAVPTPTPPIENANSDEIDAPLGAVPEQYGFGDFEPVDGVMVLKKIVCR
jgi:hypothetical protein